MNYEISFDYWESEHDLQYMEARDVVITELEWKLQDLEFVEVDSLRWGMSRGYVVIRCSDPVPMTESRLRELLDNFEDIENVRIVEEPE